MATLVEQPVTIMTATAATTSQTSGDFATDRCMGGIFYLNITSNPGGAETLQLFIQAKDPISGNYRSVTAYPACTAATNNVFPHFIFPGAFHNSAHTTSHAWGTFLPDDFRIVITHSASGAWTYTVNFVPKRGKAWQ
jgi:hypothetical protein